MTPLWKQLQNSFANSSIDLEGCQDLVSERNFAAGMKLPVGSVFGDLNRIRQRITVFGTRVANCNDYPLLSLGLDESRLDGLQR
ncbi:hypothetical protein GC197_15005 [bacterium]|nr:hypothetical protein [bacterium]